MVKKLDSSKMDVWREAIKSSLFSGTGKLFTILLTIILTQFLTIEQVGYYFFLIAVIYLLQEINDGMSVAVKKRVSETNTAREQYPVATLLISLLLSILTIPVGLLFVYIEQLFIITEFEFDILVIIIISTVVFFRGIEYIMHSYLSGIGKPGRASLLRNYIRRPLRVLFIFILLISDVTTIEYIILAGGTAFLISGVCIYIISNFNLFKGIQQVSTLTVISLWEFSKWSIPNKFLNDFYNRFDTLILAVMVGAVSISYYDGSIRIITISFAVLVGLTHALTIKISGLHTEDYRDELFIHFTNFYTVATIIPYFFLGIVVLYGEQILSFLFTEEYTGAYLFLVLLGIQMVFQSVRLNYEALFNGIDKPRIITKASIVSVIINIITAPVLVIIFNGIGVIISTLTAELFRVLIFEKSIIKEFNTIHKPVQVLLQAIGTVTILIIVQVFTSSIIIGLPAYVFIFTVVTIIYLIILIQKT